MYGQCTLFSLFSQNEPLFKLIWIFYFLAAQDGTLFMKKKKKIFCLELERKFIHTYKFFYLLHTTKILFVYVYSLITNWIPVGILSARARARGTAMYILGGGGGAGGVFVVNCGTDVRARFRNLPHSYTWPLKKY